MAHVANRGARVMAWPANTSGMSCIVDVRDLGDHEVREQPLCRDEDHLQSALNASEESMLLRTCSKLDGHVRPHDKVAAAPCVPIDRSSQVKFH